MSVTTSIDFSFALRDRPERFVVELFAALLGGPWDIGEPVIFLPLGDADEYAWTTQQFNQAQVLQLLEAKELHGERPGIALTIENEHRGGHFLHLGNGLISLSPSINRAVLERHKRVTDFSWYVDRVLACTGKLQGAVLQSISINEAM